MKNGIILGIALGFVAGAVLVNNCCSVRNAVDDTQRKVVSKLKNKGEKIMSKLENQQCECASDFSGCCNCECDYEQELPMEK